MEIEKQKAIIEAILFAAGRVIKISELMGILELSSDDVVTIIDSMKEDYKKSDRGIEIIRVEDGYQLTTKKEMYEYLYPIFDKRSKPNLTQASMETLAIIAYNPKITRAEIEAIRGVNSDGTIYKLLEFNLIESVGKADLPGRPTMYATTPNFLKMFGMSSLEELPELPKYKLDENQQLVIDDIISSEEQESQVESGKTNEEKRVENEVKDMNDTENEVNLDIKNDEEVSSEAPMPERENEDVIKNNNI